MPGRSVAGGDDQGSPGIAIYLQGMVLGALVSTGEQYWKVETIGLLPNNTWNNIGQYTTSRTPQVAQ